jgi:hypothetical protein
METEDPVYVLVPPIQTVEPEPPAMLGPTVTALKRD